MYLIIKDARLADIFSVSCSAGTEGAFHLAHIPASSTSFVEVNNTASSFGTAPSNSWLLTSDAEEGIGRFIVQNMNQSFNQGLSFGSALYMSRHGTLAFHFCCFESNTNGNCLILRQTTSNSVSCVLFFNNTATSPSATYAGFLYVRANYVLSEFVFQKNDFAVFIAGYSAFTTTFVRTVFDRGTFSFANSCSMVTSNCRVQTDGQATLDVVSCPFPARVMETELRLMTRTDSEVGVVTETESVSVSVALKKSQTLTFTVSLLALRSRSWVILRFSVFLFVCPLP
jgi:hypothetical protein